MPSLWDGCHVELYIGRSLGSWARLKRGQQIGQKVRHSVYNNDSSEAAGAGPQHTLEETGHRSNHNRVADGHEQRRMH